MKNYRVYQVDSFTTEPFRGNPAGVVPHADGLSDAEMQQIARELNNPETAFIFSPNGSDHDVRIRFFTPAVEVPTCGHATIAAHYVRALENHLPPGKVLQKIGIGILPVYLHKNGERYSVTMVQNKPDFGEILTGSLKTEILTAIGLTDNDLLENAPVQIVSTGHAKVMIAINSRKKLNALQPDFRTLKMLSKRIGTNAYFVFTLDSDAPGVLTHARMFGPAIGIDEDPVTGMGNGPLGAYLVKHKLTRFAGSRFSFTAQQGEAIGRTGQMTVTVDIDAGDPVGVSITGEARVVFRTEISI